MPPPMTVPSPLLYHQWGEVIGRQMVGMEKEGFLNQPDQQSRLTWEVVKLPSLEVCKERLTDEGLP